MLGRSLLVCVALAGCGVRSYALEVEPGEHVILDDGVNGDVRCDRGTLLLPARAVINGALDARYCVLKIAGTVNGPLTADGGIVHVVDALTINGDLTVSDARELVVSGADFNGGAEVRRTHVVHVVASGFNGSGTFEDNGELDIRDSAFNGELEIRGSTSCVEHDNTTNGAIVAADCR